MRDVPQDLVVGRGVEEAPQRPPQTGRHLPKRPDRLGGERRCRRHLPGQEREQPREVKLAIGSRHLDPGCPHRAQQGTHYRQARIHPLYVTESSGLHVYDRGAICRIRDLEQEASADPRIRFEVLVPFAREGSQGRFHPEAVSEDLPGCFQCQGRRRGLERVKALHHRAEGYLASQPAALVACCSAAWHAATLRARALREAASQGRGTDARG